MQLKKTLDIFKRSYFQVLVVAVLVVISYVNILGNGLSFDDRDFLAEWPVVRDSESGLSAFLSLPDLLAGELPSHHQGVYRPIRSVYYLFSLQLWGFNPFAFHLQAIIVHLLITVTIYFIVKLLIKDASPKAKILPFLTAGLFATHPIHTEAITYTAASFDSIGILFFFASFYFYLRAEFAKVEQKITRLLSWLLAFLAFFTYELTLTLPLLIIFYDFCFKKLNFKNLLTRIRVYLPYLILLIAYLAVRFLLLKIGNRADYLGLAYVAASNQAKLSTPEILIKYVYLLIFPVNLTISYPMPDIVFPYFFKTVNSIDPSGRLLVIISNYIFIFPLLLLASLILLVIRKLNTHKLVIFGIGWFLLSLLPVLNILPQGAAVAERFLYIPSFGFCLLLGLGIYKITNVKVVKTSVTPKIITGSLIFVLIISLYSARTIIRNFDWKNQETIFLSALRIHPQDFTANAALASVTFEQGRYQETIKYSKTALAQDSSAFNIYNLLGLAYERSGNIDQAEAAYNQTLKVNPEYYPALVGLGNIDKLKSRNDQAIDRYQKALKIYPDNFEAHFNLAGAYLNKKEYSLALDQYNKASKLNPDNGAVYGNIGFIQEQLGNLNQAIEQYKLAVKIEEKNFFFRLNLANAYLKIDEKQLALEQFKKALSMKQDDETIKEKIRSIEQNH